MVNLPAVIISMAVAGLLALGTRESATVNMVLVFVKIIALVNDGPNAMWRYDPGDQLDYAGEFMVSGMWAQDADRLEDLWRIGNREGADLNGKTWSPDVRSMCVGDVALIVTGGGFEPWLCDHTSWRKLEPDEVLASLVSVGAPHLCQAMTRTKYLATQAAGVGGSA